MKCLLLIAYLCTNLFYEAYSVANNYHAVQYRLLTEVYIFAV